MDKVRYYPWRNTSDKKEGVGFFVDTLDGGCTVKYVARDDADLVLISENREHLQVRITVREGEAGPIVGRICWSWRVCV